VGRQQEYRRQKLTSSQPFYQDKLHEPVLYARFQDILQKVSCRSLFDGFELTRRPEPTSRPTSPRRS
jgi:hypothetical protein